MIEHFYGQGVMYTQDYWNGIMEKIPFDLLAQFLRGKKRSEKRLTFVEIGSRYSFTYYFSL